jgi:hypothetical protein
MAMTSITEGYLTLSVGELWLELSRDVVNLIGAEQRELRYSSHYALGRYVKCYINHVELAMWPCVPESNQASVVLFFSRPSYLEIPDLREREEILASVAKTSFKTIREHYGHRLQFDDWDVGGEDIIELLFLSHESDEDEAISGFG